MIVGLHEGTRNKNGSSEESRYFYQGSESSERGKITYYTKDGYVPF